MIRGLLTALLLGCGAGGGEDAPADAAARDFATVDAVARDAALADAAVDDGPRALVLDPEMRHPLVWDGLRATLAARGFAVDYRRGFPHFTEADRRYQMVVLASGAAPASPTVWTRAEEVERLAGWVRDGGGLLLAPTNGWSDGQRGAFDRDTTNRLLRALEVPIRVDAATLVGDVAPAEAPRPPLHQTTPWGYPGPLEWTLLLPAGFPAEEAALGARVFAAGWVSPLACDGDGVTVLARAHADAYVWRRLGGPEEGRVELPGEPRPLAALGPAGAGWVAVVPRSLLEMGTLSMVGGDRPSLEPELLDGTVEFARAAVDRLVDGVRGEGLHLPTGCHGGPTLAEVDALPTHTLPESAPLPPAPPAPPEWASGAPRAGAATGVPPWFRGGGATLVYGDLRSPEEMAWYFERAEEAGVDALLSSVGDDALRAYTSGDPTSPFAAMAGAARIPWIVGSFWRNGVYAAEPTRFGPAVDAFGRPLDAPAPLAEAWWAEGVAPLVLAAARLAADHPEVVGFTLDLELYGTGALHYHAGHAFDPETWAVVVAALREHDPELAGGAEAVATDGRLRWLVERGLLLFAWRTLEDAVTARASALREAAHAIAPGLTLGFYVAYPQTSWFYAGLMRGLGTSGRPALLLSYDHGTRRARELLAAEGIHVRALGGVLGVRFSARDLGTALQAARETSDGAWLFRYGDFGPAVDPATRHDPVERDWEAVGAAH